jgi:hypothetical protein
MGTRSLRRRILALSIGVASSLLPAAPASAQNQKASVREVRTIRAARRGFPTPAGIAHWPGTDAFLVLGANPTPGLVGSEMNWITPFGDSRGFARLARAISNPLNVAFDAKGGRLLILEARRGELTAIPVRPDGALDPAREVRYPVLRLGAVDPQGITVDPASGRLFVLDRGGPWLLRVEPDAEGGFEAAEVSRADLGPLGLTNTRGLAFDPTTGHLHVLTGPKWTLHELTEAGDLVATRDLSGLGIFDPGGMVFAPSGDMTDDPGQMSLYVADGGRHGPQAFATATGQGGPLRPGAAPQTGGVVELTFLPPAVAPPASFFSSVVTETLTSLWSPPAPDTSDVAYLPPAPGQPGPGTLLVVDSEVEEMTIWAGVSEWETTLGGSVLRTFDLTYFTKEPTGLSVNPLNRHLFYSNDEQKRVNEIDPGPDGLYHTADDIMTSFSVSSFSGDTEEATYDPLEGALFLLDGVNNEVYRITPGANGKFDGLPPAGDDQMTHFDTSSWVSDPEGMTLNTDNGHLYIGGRPDTQVVEITTSGAFVQTIDISAAKASKEAGLGYGPGSTNPAAKRLYVVQRGVDNDKHPTENDGKLWEMTLPSSGPPSNQAPVVSAGPDLAVTLPNSANLNGTVTDDGLPNPPGAVTQTWSMVSGPGSVTFSNANAPTTPASFSTAGVYTLRLTANDGALSASDDVVVTVNAAGNLAPSVNAGTDQTITLPASANLDGTVTDDGLPAPPSLATSWTKLNGPGTVSFGNASAVDTTASFSIAGVYTLRLTASDGILSAFDDVVVTVNNPGGAIIFEKRLAASSDDAEQYLSTGAVNITSTDLELTLEATTQAVGMRFTGVTIPQGAAIVNAWIQFKVDETGSTATSLNFQGQAADNPATFTTSANNVTLRPLTVASVNWVPAPWTVVNEVGPAEQTPNLATVIQEIVSRSGWANGNSLVIVVTGTGKRVARSFDFAAGDAPLLHVEYGGGGGGNLPPSVNAGPDLAVTLPNTATLDGTVTDDGLPNPPATVTQTWSKVSGPGTVTFTDASAVDTTATFSAAGTYVLRLTASDSALSTSDDATITVQPSGPTNQAPVVSAGPDLAVTLPNGATLDGTVTDDGLPNPPATVTQTWSKVSGPGTVTFTAASAVDTTATFSAAGTYVLRLTASDSALSTSDDATITVNTGGGQAPLSVIKQGAIHSATAASSYSFAPATASNGRLYIAFVSTSIASGTAPSATSVSGAGLTFTEVGTTGGLPYSGTSGNRRIQAWRALVTAGATTGSIAITLNGTSTAMDAVLLEFGGVDTSGTNGSGAVVQSTSKAGSGTSLALTLSAFGSSNNRPVAFFNHRVNEATTEKLGYTELDDGTHGTPIAGAECEWNASTADTTPSASWATSANAGGFAIEVKAGSGP